MGLITIMDSEPTPARRVARLAREVGEVHARYVQGEGLGGTEVATLYGILSKHMCWDAALLCAWAVNGVKCDGLNLYGKGGGFNILSDYDYGRLFRGKPSRHALKSVTSGKDFITLPVGCFVGFFAADGRLRHVMIHVHKGMGAGTKNDCVLPSGSLFGWELLDMTEYFFTRTDKDPKRREANTAGFVVYAEITGQTV